MRATRIVIDQYRSIEHIELTIPEGKPLVLFGPNNAGKSNIISAISRILGERFAPYIEMQDSDFFMRDKAKYPNAWIGCHFDAPYHRDRTGKEYHECYVKYCKEASENTYCDSHEKKLYISNADRSAIQAHLVDAERSINYQLSYSSRYTLLSKFSHAVHSALSENEKDSLDNAFQQIKGVFEGIPEYASFAEHFAATVQDSVQGFIHKLEVDFSAYDPNNYANAMRILAKEGNSVRAFEEFGTGEQQVLLMAFAKAFMQTFGSDSIVLVLEEPEAHLHPLAQRWLKEYIYDLCDSGIQVVISTHSADFVDSGNLEGVVRVWKDCQGVTNVVQLSSRDLVDQCVAMGVPNGKVSEIGISRFYQAKLSSEITKGLFASRVLLVEGPTETQALPIYFKRAGFSPSAVGLEIIGCGGKGNIPSFYRLFTAFGIDCFCLFDGDESRGNNKELAELLGISSMNLGTPSFEVGGNYAYFSKDFETTAQNEITDYGAFESDARASYHISGKPAIARFVAELSGSSPSFIVELIQALSGMTACGSSISQLDSAKREEGAFNNCSL
ncbi:ATP-dependent nuclease [Senegalimassilia anaerobia]